MNVLCSSDKVFCIQTATASYIMYSWFWIFTSMAQGVDKLQIFLLAPVPIKYMRLFYFPLTNEAAHCYWIISHTARIPYWLTEIYPYALPSECTWARLCPVRLVHGKTFSHPKKKERLEEKQQHPIYHQRQLENATEKSEASLFPLSHSISQVEGRRGTTPTYFGSDKFGYLISIMVV